MRILITGASGFVGWNAVRYFVERGDEVIETTRSLSHYLQTDGARPVTLDLADGAAISTVVARFQPDIILHAAALTRPQHSSDRDVVRAINVTATEQIAQAAARVDAGVVFLSTDLVFDDSAGRCTELTPPRPSGAGYYSRSKLEAEERLAMAGCRWIVLRPSLMFGRTPPSGNSFSAFIDRSWQRGEPVPLFTDQFRSFLYVRDLCAAVEATAIVHARWGELFVCGGPERLSRAEFGERYADACGVDRAMCAPMLSSQLPGYIGGPSDISLDCARLGALGWKPRHVEESVLEMLEGGSDRP